MLKKTGDRYLDCGEYHDMVYDSTGRYIGQYQDNMLDDHPSLLFIGTDTDEQGRPCVNDVPVPNLTAEQMAAADAEAAAMYA